ncbi:hypothetical protein PE067_10680 [Paracoccus sp. DMF-8]|uniref:hypothetical protein n=1 Tax=Paracoccus sp. DMF-8 TaxID=3019445 RepID=UPI0023E7C03B|nr:hypothetical protein [Paracoccus sp. DMF-8]MDF3606566.1 hypothetical protein [Paracoccus sp. DMF-8]
MPTFGLTISMIDGEPRPATWGDLSILGIIGVAPDADPDVFPYDEPVLVRTSDAAMITALGAAGTLADAVKMVNSQLGNSRLRRWPSSSGLPLASTRRPPSPTLSATAP